MAATGPLKQMLSVFSRAVLVGSMEQWKLVAWELRQRGCLAEGPHDWPREPLGSGPARPPGSCIFARNP